VFGGESGIGGGKAGVRSGGGAVGAGVPILLGLGAMPTVSVAKLTAKGKSENVELPKLSTKVRIFGYEGALKPKFGTSTNSIGL
jgi:hypothetical protein